MAQPLPQIDKLWQDSRHGGSSRLLIRENMLDESCHSIGHPKGSATVRRQREWGERGAGIDSFWQMMSNFREPSLSLTTLRYLLFEIRIDDTHIMECRRGSAFVKPSSSDCCWFLFLHSCLPWMKAAVVVVCFSSSNKVDEVSSSKWVSCHVEKPTKAGHDETCCCRRGMIVFDASISALPACVCLERHDSNQANNNSKSTRRLSIIPCATLMESCTLTPHGVWKRERDIMSPPHSSTSTLTPGGGSRSWWIDSWYTSHTQKAKRMICFSWKRLHYCI